MLRRIIGMATRRGARPGPGPAGGARPGPRPGPRPGAGTSGNAEIQRGVRSVVRGLGKRKKL